MVGKEQERKIICLLVFRVTILSCFLKLKWLACRFPQGRLYLGNSLSKLGYDTGDSWLKQNSVNCEYPMSPRIIKWIAKVPNEGKELQKVRFQMQLSVSWREQETGQSWKMFCGDLGSSVFSVLSHSLHK